MKKIVYILLAGIVFSSCSNDLSSLNNDEKNASLVPSDVLFTSAERSLSDHMTSTSVNRNVFRLIVQQFTETTYTDESNYDFVTRKISDNQWTSLYAGTLADLNLAKTKLENETIPSNDPDIVNKTTIKNNKLAQINLLMAYTFQVLVDTNGDIPYSEALKEGSNYLPKYDKAVDVYKSLIVKVSDAVTKLNNSQSGFESADVIYNGNIDKWIKFGNSLKLKLGINLLASNSENTIATQAINTAISGGLIASNSDNCKLPYMANLPNTNPLYVDLVASGRHDFVVTKTMVDKLISLNDPRRAIYTDNNPNGGIVGSSNSYSGSAKKTHVGSIIEDPTLSGNLLDYAEVEFLLAEAAEIGITAAGSAASHYNNAIAASMEDWGVSSAEITTYLTQTSVNYSTAAGTWQQKIGEQAWLALYNRGFQAWTSYRRLDFPVLVAPSGAQAAAEGKVPVRMAYPIREQTLNPTNYNAASTAIGGDKLTTKIFWDKF